MRSFIIGMFGIVAWVGVARATSELTGAEIVQRVLLSDPWGLCGAEIAARATLIDKHGSKSVLAFHMKSRQYDPPLTKSIVRFSQPVDLAGAGFLQVQKREGDDDRFLFFPDLKRSRRIAAGQRGMAFMGTDYTHADLDRRDLRDSSAQLKGKENLGKYPCYRVELTTGRADSDYSRIDMFARVDNFLPLRMTMYDRAGTLLKTFEAQEVKRVDGKWFISRSRMTNHQQQHSTEMVLEQIVVRDFDDEHFTVRMLEKQ
jgi:hypothetical protein